VEVARALQVTRQSVHNWVSRYRRQSEPAALVNAPKSRRPRKADEAAETLLQALMMISPERCGYHVTHWTVPLLQEWSIEPRSTANIRRVATQILAQAHSVK
jgi:transposase